MNSKNVPEFMLIFFKYLWVFVIAVTCFNAVMMSFHMKQASVKDRLKMMLGMAFWLNVPWIVMGIGSTIGKVPSFFHFLRPRDGNPFVLAYWISIVAVYLIGSYWIFIGRGAAKLAESGVIRYRSMGKTSTVSSEKGVKLFFLLMLFGGLVAGIIFLSMDIPIPPFVK